MRPTELHGEENRTARRRKKRDEEEDDDELAPNWPFFFRLESNTAEEKYSKHVVVDHEVVATNPPHTHAGRDQSRAGSPLLRRGSFHLLYDNHLRFLYHNPNAPPPHARVFKGVAKSQFSPQGSCFQKWSDTLLNEFTPSNTLAWCHRRARAHAPGLVCVCV